MNEKNTLYFGDNLQVLREHIADASVDLIYLDPPFNSKRDYNLLFKTPKAPKRAKGNEAPRAAPVEAESSYGDAQITAFEDTWHWGPQAENEFREIVHQTNTDVAELMQALRSFLKENDMMAYLSAMCIRLLELHRVLKPTGSLYLHCDPTASHYLKLVLDGVFGPERFLNEIIWKRTTAHSGAKRFAPVHDTLLVYTKSEHFQWNDMRVEYEQAYLDKYYKFDDGDGRRYWRADLCAAGTRKGESGKPWRGIDPGVKGMHWKYTVTRLDELDAEGRIYWPPAGTMPQYKRYIDELKGKAIGDIWDDIDRINPVGAERLGYPTQKPLALLERIIAASSNKNQLVLDPFCGCGTAVHAAETLNRRWIGIDITHLSIGLIERRLKDAFADIQFAVEGTPNDLAGARELAERDKHQFQLWACGLVNAQPYQGGRKGADRGIDGLLYIEAGKKTEKVIVQVKGGASITRANIATLKGDVDREKAAIGLFVTLAEPTREMVKEAAAAGHFEGTHFAAVPKIQILTIEQLLAGQRPLLPDASRGAQTFKKAKLEGRDAKKEKAQGNLGF